MSHSDWNPGPPDFTAGSVHYTTLGRKKDDGTGKGKGRRSEGKKGRG